MGDLSSVDTILEFLRRNNFTRAEAALRGELTNQPDTDGVLQKHTLEHKVLNGPLDESNGRKTSRENMGTDYQNKGESGRDMGFRSSTEVSKEFIISEIEYGSWRNGPGCKWKNVANSGEQGKVCESVSTSENNFKSNGSKEIAFDLYSLNYNPNNGPDVSHQNDCGSANMESVIGKELLNPSESHNELRKSSLRSTNKTPMERKQEKSQKQSGSCPQDAFSDKSWNDCALETIFPFSKEDASMWYDHKTVIGDKIEVKGKPEMIDIKTAIEEQADEIGKRLYFARACGSGPKDLSGFDFALASESQKEELPILPPVRLKSQEKSFNILWEEKCERDGNDSSILDTDKTYRTGSFLDVAVGQEINPSGVKGHVGRGSLLSVCQVIAEDTSDLASGFASIGGLSEQGFYPNEYWDSDEYDDDDDVGYTRQPIEDEDWFLAHEIDYPIDPKNKTGDEDVPDPQRSQNREEDEQSFAEEEDSDFLREQYVKSRAVDGIGHGDDLTDLVITEKYWRANDEFTAQCDSHLIDKDELILAPAEPVWQGFVTQTNELLMLGNEKLLSECVKSHLNEVCMDDNHHESVRSIGVGISKDAACVASEVRQSQVGLSFDGDIQYVSDSHVSVGGSRHVWDASSKTSSKRSKNHLDGGFPFPPPRDGLLVQSDCGKSAAADDSDNYLANDDILVPKSGESSPVYNSRYKNDANVTKSASSSSSSLSNDGYMEYDIAKKEHDAEVNAREEDQGASLEDEEVVAVQEQVKQIKAQEEEFETFNLKVVHRKNRTGFEEDKNFEVVINSVIAGRYHVTEYLGSAAFSKAIQAHDLHTGMDVCVKVIKNNKDFFDQSLDEIKLLKFVNKNDPGDKYHVLRLYDYFYYREHLLIVCELLKANLYEFHKFNRESGGEVYFTMPRLQSITTQCLEALQFLHSLGLIHCDLKPENILVKSYSRCEVKVIDLGSSCFETDHLCSYVQSRSYRAPEVILGLPYNKKIDIWSLGCILAELCTGNVLFQNDSPATLLARVLGILGPIDQEMLAKGKDTFKYFTKNHMLYEKNQETNKLEYLIPKKTALRHRLPVGDQGFIDFLTHLLEINPEKRPSATEALKHPWLSYPYEPISS
ncbi:unnamed protein product [Cuscuta europaea]|uniref:Protein kinase domain-containing protein n=1 Tax=Cuscuta europaea TaxID=41803 RepID=A0A9P1DVA2_CUSEU|nr:unnamed protein product [Cuscuta europaea]